MHSAANSQFTQKGVWKIGDAHVKHIELKYSPEYIKYNLIGETAFQQEFEDWIPPAPEESESQNKTTQVGSESEETMVPTNPLYSSSADKKSQETTKGSKKVRDLLKDE